jgi:hypothetical protein
MENDPIGAYYFTIGAAIMSVALFALIFCAEYAFARYKHTQINWRILLHETFRKPWVLCLLAAWMTLLVFASIGNSEASNDSKSANMTFTQAAGHNFGVTATVTSDQTFAKGRSTLFSVALAPNPAPAPQGIRTTLTVMQDGAMKLLPVVTANGAALSQSPRWDYIVTPTVDGHSIVALVVCAYRAQVSLGCADWAIPIYVRQWLVPPGLINISNWSALVAFITSALALLGAISQVLKRRIAPATVPDASVDGVHTITGRAT